MRLLPLLLLATACTPSLELTKSNPVGWLAAARTLDAEEDAVVLERTEDWLLHARPRRDWFEEVHTKVVIAIRSESGFRFAEHKWRQHESTELIAFRARTIKPDGRIIEVDRSAIFETKEQGEDDAEEYTAHAFTFPDVSVGCVLEVSRIYHSKGLGSEFSAFPQGDLPILEYRFSVTGTDEVKPAMKIFNSGVGLDVWDHPTGWRMAWSPTKLPAESDEDFRPHYSSREPWAVLRVKQVVFPYWSWDRRKDWKGVYKWRAIPLYIENEKTLAGFDAKLDVGKGVSVQTIVGAGLEWIREHTRYVGRGGLDPLKEVLETRKASDRERAMILWKLLERAGVKSQFALARRFRSWDIGLKFPTHRVFDQTLLYVPSQAGLAEPIWIDPACDHCKVGELPRWSRSVPAQILSAKKGRKEVEVKARSVVTRGAAPPARTLFEAIEAKLRPDLQLEGTLRVTREGGAAASWSRRRGAWTRKQWEDADESLRAARFPTGSVEVEAKMKCEGSVSCARTLKLSMPEYATEAEGRVLVPLSMLSERGDYFEEQERTEEISVAWDSSLVDTLALEIPEGWTVAELPQAEELSGPGFDYSFEAAVEGQKINVARRLSYKVGGYPAAQYAKIRAPARAWVAARNKVIALKRAK